MNYKGFEITTNRIPGNSKRCWDGSAIIPGDEGSRLVSMTQYTEVDVVEQLKRFIDYWTRPYAGVKREKLEDSCERLTAELERLRAVIQKAADNINEAAAELNRPEMQSFNEDDDPGGVANENFNHGFWDCAEYAIKQIEGVLQETPE